jgi:hypothetical protein
MESKLVFEVKVSKRRFVAVLKAVVVKLSIVEGMKFKLYIDVALSQNIKFLTIDKTLNEFVC